MSTRLFISAATCSHILTVLHVLHTIEINKFFIIPIFETIYNNQRTCFHILLLTRIANNYTKCSNIDQLLLSKNEKMKKNKNLYSVRSIKLDAIA